MIDHADITKARRQLRKRGGTAEVTTMVGDIKVTKQAMLDWLVEVEHWYIGDGDPDALDSWFLFTSRYGVTLYAPGVS